MTYTLDGNILPGLNSGYKRISSNYVAAQSQVDLSAGNWNNIGQQVEDVNNLLPNNLKIPDTATYILTSISGALFSNNGAGLTHSFNITSYYDVAGLRPFDEKFFLAREFVAVAPANTQIFESSCLFILPIISNNAKVSTKLTFVGNANNGVNSIFLLGYWDCITPI